MKKIRVSLQRKIWAKIRCWQSMNEVSDNQLASSLTVAERTLRNYDKDAGKLSLEKVDNFLNFFGIEITDLLNL